jgi:hypothetical protein
MKKESMPHVTKRLATWHYTTFQSFIEGDYCLIFP